MKKVVAAFLLVGALSVGVSVASPAFANRYDDLVRHQRNQKYRERDRDQALKQGNFKKARDEERRAEYARKRQRELQREIKSQNKRKK